MKSSEKPVILLIPGAWHDGNIYDLVAARLQANGYPTMIMTLLSAGGPTSTTVSDDAEHIRKKLIGLLDQGQEVIMVMHSYGGIPGTECIRGLTRQDMASTSRQGGVIALLYVAAFLIPAGECVDSSIPGGAAASINFEGDRSYMKNPATKFYNDLDEVTAAKWTAALVYHAKPAFFTPLTYEAYRDVYTMYLLCEKDLAIPFSSQQAMAAAPGQGVVETRICAAGHSPMLSMPELVADTIEVVACKASKGS